MIKMQQNKIRLHKYLSQIIKKYSNHDYSIPEIKRNISNYGAYINGFICKNQLEWILDGLDKVTYDHWPRRDSVVIDSIKIVHEDSYCMIINKDYGVVVEPGTGHQKNNLVTWLHTNYPEQNFRKLYKDKNLPASGLVHRIDRYTQGLLLIAKKPNYLDFFKEQFKNRTVTKKYLALVNGEVEKVWHINNWQARDKNNSIRNKIFWSEIEAKNYDQKARFAKSIIKPVYYCQQTNQSIIQVQIFTGRMHQIRLQCESIGCPLVNDIVYNKQIELDIYNYTKSNNLYLKNQTNQLNKNTTNNILATSNTNKTFYSCSDKFIVEQLGVEGFEKQKQSIFGIHQYGLVSNYLQLKLPNNRVLEVILREV